MPGFKLYISYAATELDYFDLIQTEISTSFPASYICIS